MTESHCDEALIVLNVPPNLEDLVIDWLLARESDTGFTSFPVSGHSTSHSELSPAEQVSGRERRQMFQVQIKRDAVDSFLDDARESLGAVGAHFWVLPLIAGGQLRKTS
jgi:hypothetical protein